MNKKQSIFRNKYETDFTILGNKTLEDERMTFEARGLLCFILCKPPNWTVVVEHLTNSSPSGKHKIRRMIDELLRYGYMIRIRERGSKGRFIRTIYETYGEPQFDYREVDNRDTDYLDTDNQPLVSKQGSKETNNKKTTTNQKIPISIFSWPKNIDFEKQKSILDLSKDVNVFFIQKILDVMIASSTPIRNPVAYYRSLKEKSLVGLLDTIPSNNLQDKRNKKIQGEQSYKDLLAASERIILEIMKADTSTDSQS